MSDLTPDGAAYVAKLKRGRRPGAVMGAFVLLLGAVLQFGRRVARGIVVLDIAPQTRLLARALVGYAAVQVQAPVDLRGAAGVVAQQLERQIVQYATKAVGEGLRGEPLAERLTLIVVAETQAATVTALQQALPATTATAVVRQTHGADPCETCVGLEGVYNAPFPAELWWTHPRCCCSWQAGYANT